MALWLALLAGGAAPVRAQVPDPGQERPALGASDLEARLDAVVDAYVQREEFSGSVLITQRGRLLYWRGFGLADRAQGAANGPDTRFLLASISKQFTAVLALRQVELGQLRLEAPIGDVLTGLPPAWRGITLHQLLNHSSGIVNHLSRSVLDPIRHLELTPAEIIDRVRNQPLLFAPGARHSYSNTNYVLVGMLLERVTGTALVELLRTEVFEPLALANMGVKPAGGVPGARALGYRHDGNQRWLAGLPIHPSILFGAGDLYADPYDLNAWTEAFWESDRLVGHATRERMTTPSAGRYGYGFRTDRPAALGGRAEVYHTGHVKGFANYLGRVVDEGLTLVVLGNLSTAPSRRISHELARVALNLP